MNVRQLPVIAAVLSLGLTVSAHAVTAYNVPAGTAGNQSFGGSLGMDFDVLSPINVSELGVFDSNSDGLGRTITAYIYDRTTQSPLTSLVFSPGDPGTLVGGSRFKPLGTPLALPAGFQGTVVAENYGAAEMNGNAGGGVPVWTTDSGGGLLAFVGDSRHGAAGAFPTTIDGGPANRYAAGTFVFDAASVDAGRSGEIIPVPNGSFEDPPRAPNGFGPATGWTSTNAGNFNPTSPPRFSEPLPDGAHVGFVNPGGSLVSDPLPFQLEPDTLYIVHTSVGDRLDTGPPVFSIDLRADGQFLAFANNSNLMNIAPPADGGFADARLYATQNHNVPAGADLQVRLTADGNQAIYDNVRVEVVRGAAVPVGNHSFEVDDVPSNNGFQFGATDWVQGGAGGGGVFEGAGEIVPADGSQSAFIRGTGSLSQVLEHTMAQNGHRYVLMVDVADRNSTPFAGYQVELLADGQLLGVDANSLALTGLSGEFFTASVIDVVVPSDFPGIGSPLEIRLSALGTTGNQTYFDNVRLFDIAPIPEPASASLLLLGGAVLLRRRRGA